LRDRQQADGEQTGHENLLHLLPLLFWKDELGVFRSPPLENCPLDT
jgi:hypothetical protein